MTASFQTLYASEDITNSCHQLALSSSRHPLLIRPRPPSIMKTFNRQSTGIEVVEELQQYVDGKTILITGASVKGLGAETALSLAHANPAHILLHGRTASKINSVIAEINKLNPAIKTIFVHADFSSLASVREAAKFVNSRINKLDILINNAGIMAVKEYATTEDGIESQFGTNHVAHFLLTNLLMPRILAAGDGARIVNVSSDGYLIGPFRFDDYNFSNGKLYDQWSSYGQSKTANILFTKSLASRLASKGMASFSLHPGVIMDTSLGDHVPQEDFAEITKVTRRNTGKDFELDFPVKSRQQGCATTLVTALDPRLKANSGAYLTDCQLRALDPRCERVEDAQRLWEISETLVGEKFDLR
jgi:NAD(P)-dependent dehydrogenase (short-subunit alcohol dehydrogenase family)